MAEEFYEPAIRRSDIQYGEGYGKGFFGRLNKLDPEISMLFQRFFHGGLYEREILSHKVRELCAIAALVVTGKTLQLRAHFTAAHNYGAEEKEILEVVFQMATYIGAPSVLEALKVYEDWVASGHSMTGFGRGEK